MKRINIEITRNYKRWEWCKFGARTSKGDLCEIATGLSGGSIDPMTVIAKPGKSWVRDTLDAVRLQHSFRLRLTTCLEDGKHVFCIHVWGYDKKGKVMVHRKNIYHY